jgi:hypothetical protein
MSKTFVEKDLRAPTPKFTNDLELTLQKNNHESQEEEEELFQSPRIELFLNSDPLVRKTSSSLAKQSSADHDTTFIPPPLQA